MYAGHAGISVPPPYINGDLMDAREKLIQYMDKKFKEERNEKRIRTDKEKNRQPIK